MLDQSLIFYCRSLLRCHITVPNKFGFGEVIQLLRKFTFKKFLSLNSDLNIILKDIKNLNIILF